jgi:hypothetical protein
VDNISLVQIIDGLENLADGQGGIFFRELALLANTIEELSACCKLGDDVVLVLTRLSAIPRRRAADRAHLGLKPFIESDNVWMVHITQHFHLVVHHLFVASNILLQDYLHGALALWTVRLAHNSVGASAKSLAESVVGPVCVAELVWTEPDNCHDLLSVVALGLAM